MTAPAPAPAFRSELDGRYVLDVDVPTSIGIFSAGLTVQLVEQRGPRLLVCLDAGHVSGTRCHAELLPVGSVRFAVDPGPATRAAA